MMQAARIVTSWKDGKMRILCPGFTGGNALTTGISLLSLSDKSAVDVVGDLDVDCATGYVSVTDSVFYFLIYSSFLFFLYYLLLA